MNLSHKKWQYLKIKIFYYKDLNAEFLNIVESRDFFFFISLGGFRVIKWWAGMM